MYQRSFWTKLRRSLNPVVVTFITIVVLAIFLMPFLYMIFTSLKSPNQFAALGAPIWPARTAHAGVQRRKYWHLHFSGNPGQPGE